MVLALKKDEYLNDRAAEIMSQLHKYKKIGLWAAMGLGKTEFFKKALREYAKRNDLVLVMVNPSVGQIEQIGENDPSIATVCQGKSYYGEKVVITTPESLYKVTNSLLEANKRFILVFDEAHEKVAGINFRSKFGVIDKYELLADKVIYMTATPKPLFDEDFDCIIEVDKPKKAVNCSLLSVEKVNVSTIINQIEQAILRGEKVILCHDNKTENKKIYDKLVEKYGAEYFMTIEDNEPTQETLFEDEQEPKSVVKEKAFDLVSSQDRNGSAYKEIMKNQFPKGLKVLITTSFIKAGLNIDNLPNTRMILTVNQNNFSLVDKVQQMGRLRKVENIAGIDLILPKLEVPTQCKVFLPLETVAEEMREEALFMYNTYIKDKKSLPSQSSLDAACATYDPQQDRYILDENKLRNKIYLHYCKSLLVNPNRLKIDLEREAAINLNVQIKEIETQCNEQLEQEVKDEKKAKKEAHAAACEQLKALNDEWQKVIITVPFDEIELLNDDLRPIAEAYHLTMSDAKRKFINQVRRDLCNGDKVEAHLKVLNEPKKDIEKEFDQLEVMKLNREFEEVKGQPQTIDKTIKRYKKKLAARVFFIRQQLKDIEVKRGRLSNKIVNQLAQTMIDQEYYKGKKINLIKAREMLLQDLHLIYNTRTDDKGSRISSIKY